MGTRGFTSREAEPDAAGMGPPIKPATMTGYASEEWDRVIAGYEHSRMKDRWHGLLEIHCYYYDEWRWLAERCARDEMTTECGQNGKEETSPLIKRRDFCAKMYVETGKTLGITPTGELRLPKLAPKQPTMKIARDRSRA
jgi:phage terminase small subunit